MQLYIFTGLWLCVLCQHVLHELQINVIGIDQFEKVELVLWKVVIRITEYSAIATCTFQVLCPIIGRKK